MNAQEFCYWLQGLLEVGAPKTLGKRQVRIIREHLDLVFTPATPEAKGRMKKTEKFDIKKALEGAGQRSPARRDPPLRFRRRAEVLLMGWPEQPTCHPEEVRPVFTINRGPITWMKREDGFRHCSYCGSLHPEDFLRLMDHGVKVGGADWKYGWPHKFYITTDNKPGEPGLFGEVVQRAPPRPGLR